MDINSCCCCTLCIGQVIFPNDCPRIPSSSSSSSRARIVQLDDHDNDDEDTDAVTVLEQDDDDNGGATTMGNVHINTTTTTGATPTATTMSQEQLQQMIDPSDAPRDTLRGNSYPIITALIVVPQSSSPPTLFLIYPCLILSLPHTSSHTLLPTFSLKSHLNPHPFNNTRLHPLNNTRLHPVFHDRSSDWIDDFPQHCGETICGRITI